MCTFVVHWHPVCTYRIHLHADILSLFSCSSLSSWLMKQLCFFGLRLSVSCHSRETWRDLPVKCLVWSVPLHRFASNQVIRRILSPSVASVCSVSDAFIVHAFSFHQAFLGILGYLTLGPNPQYIYPLYKSIIHHNKSYIHSYIIIFFMILQLRTVILSEQCGFT